MSQVPFFFFWACFLVTFFNRRSVRGFLRLEGYSKTILSQKSVLVTRGSIHCVFSIHFGTPGYHFGTCGHYGMEGRGTLGDPKSDCHRLFIFGGSHLESLVGFRGPESLFCLACFQGSCCTDV